MEIVKLEDNEAIHWVERVTVLSGTWMGSVSLQSEHVERKFSFIDEGQLSAR